MTAFADYDAYVAASAAYKLYRPYFRGHSNSSGNPSLQDMWVDTVVAANGGVAPTTAAAVNAGTVGAFFPDMLDSTTIYLSELSCTFGPSAFDGSHENGNGFLMVVDRLSHQGGLAANSALTQTTNLPTAALTRYTNGVGVRAFLTGYASTGVGSSAASAITSYTNQAGTGGQVSPSVFFGGSGWGTQDVTVMLPLASGDTGVKSVESVKLDVSTGSANTFGVTLAYPLAMLNIGVKYGNLVADGLFDGMLTEVQSNACICAYFHGDASNLGCTFQMLMKFITP